MMVILIVFSIMVAIMLIVVEIVMIMFILGGRGLVVKRPVPVDVCSSYILHHL
jgi:hypothetical protein